MEGGVRADREAVVRVLLVGGPMYDPLYASLPDFERETGVKVEIVARLPHPELNAMVRRTFASGGGQIDLISTHTKYAPSQAQWLATLDEDACEATELLPHPAELARIDGRLLQFPRNIDVRLLHYRRDLFEDPAEQAAFARQHGRPLAPPQTWSELVEIAGFFTRPGLFGFLFPGRDSGLFGTFYELLVTAGGELFDESLSPAFDSPAGIWAAEMIAELHHRRRVTPPNLAAWHYDEISSAFRAGHAAMVCDWPGSYHLYVNRETCTVADHVGLALLPMGPSGRRAAYAGCHSFAVTRSARRPDLAALLLAHFTGFDAQVSEARMGAIPCRADALARIRQEAAADPVEARRWDLLSETERTMIIPPRFAAYPQCEDAIWQAIQHAMEGRWTPADAVRRAAEEIFVITTAAGTTAGGLSDPGSR
jgi:multiple sugar transport system substrate-binding protein